MRCTPSPRSPQPSQFATAAVSDTARPAAPQVRSSLPEAVRRKLATKLELSAFLLDAGVPEAELEPLVARLAAEMVRCPHLSLIHI